MASTGLAHLLDALGPEPGHQPSSPHLVIDGYLLRGERDAIRIVTGELALDFDADDILELTEIDLPKGAPASLAVPVTLVLRRGARLLACSAAAEYQPLLERPVEPFAYAVRPSFPPMHQAPRYRALEDAYRERHGLA